MFFCSGIPLWGQKYTLKVPNSAPSVIGITETQKPFKGWGSVLAAATAVLSCLLCHLFSRTNPCRRADLFNYTQVNVWTAHLEAPARLKEKMRKSQVTMTCCFNAEQHQQSGTRAEDRPFVFVEMMCSPPIYEVPNHRDGENIPCEITIAPVCLLSLLSFFVTSPICIPPPFFPLLFFPHSNSASIHPTSPPTPRSCAVVQAEL